MKEKKTIILYNPISNEGHLDSWHVLFVALILKAGFSVVAMTTDPEGFRIRLFNKGIDLDYRLQIVGLNEADATLLTQNKTSLSQNLRRLWASWVAEYDLIQFQHHWKLKKIKSNVIKLIWCNAKYRVLMMVMGCANKVHGQYKLIRTKNHTSKSSTNTFLSHIDFLEQVNRVLDKFPGQIQFILNMYIDAYPSDKDRWVGFQFNQNVPWGSLCITPTEIPSQGYYAASDYKGTLLLDEGLAERYRSELSNLIFEYLPDVADTSVPSNTGALAKEILSLSGTRKIVFMGGSIGKQKNLSHWIDLISIADPEQWFFIQIGRINRNNLTLEDELALSRVVASPPDNLFILPIYLSDERAFNEIIAISDVIFAVYRDFFRSSNMLSKAAYFEKPILVSNQCLMGNRVEHYKIGFAVQQDNTFAIYQALSDLNKIEHLEANFAAYRKDFNEEIMQQKLVNFVSQYTHS